MEERDMRAEYRDGMLAGMDGKWQEAENESAIPVFRVRISQLLHSLFLEP